MIAAMMMGAWVAATWCGDVASTVLVPANAPRFSIGVVVPSGPHEGGLWAEDDGPMPAIRAVLKDPTITRSFTEGPLAGEPTPEGLRLGTVLVTLTTFDSMEDLPVAMREAAASLHRAPSSEKPHAPTPATQAGAPREPYRHLLVIVDRWTDDASTLAAIRSARNDLIGKPSNHEPPVMGKGLIDQINGLAMRYLSTGPITPVDPVTREDVRDEAADSQVQISPAVQNEKNLGMAAEVTTTSSLSPWQNSDYAVKLKRLFQRMTVCPADYNRASGVEGSWQSGNDWTAWNGAYGSSTPYTDWNFDGLWPFNGNLDSEADGAKFKASFNAGCP